MDRILISDLLVRCIVGINDDERREKQDVLINLSLSADLSKAGSNDRFEDAVDYRAIKKKVVAMAESSKFFLVEALADAVAKICLDDPRVSSAQVRIEKPTALRFARSVGVEITRDRKEGQ
jgi:D-erythro-7,8-dihydroneopterin triphosphate epimerase